MTIPEITGADVLRAIQERMKNAPAGAVLSIDLFDSDDLFKLTEQELVEKFGFDPAVASQVACDLQRRSLNQLSRVIGVKLVVDSHCTPSLIKNAGIIRSAGALMDDPESLEETLKFFHDLRHPQGR